MKKFKKLITVFALALTLAIGAFAFGGCSSSQTYEGEYGYTQYGTNYGIKVSVEVQNDKIKTVTVLDSDYVEATSSEYGWADEAVWNSNLQSLLNKFSGANVSDILAINVVCDAEGAPVASSSESFSQYGAENQYLISSCTVGSGRLILAIQNALK